MEKKTKLSPPTTIFSVGGILLLACCAIGSAGCSKPVEYSNPVGLSSPSANHIPDAAAAKNAAGGGAPAAPSGPSTAESRQMNQTYLDAYGKSGSGSTDATALKGYQERAQAQAPVK